MKPINHPDPRKDEGCAGIIMYDFMGLNPEKDEATQPCSERLMVGGREEPRVRLLGDPWRIKKRLTKSDVNDLCRLILGTAVVRQHIFSVWDDERVALVEAEGGNGVTVDVWDYDTGLTHQLVFKRWSSSKSFVFTCGWSKNFVRSRELKEGDQIGLAWDRLRSKFWFTVLNRQDVPALNVRS